MKLTRFLKIWINSCTLISNVDLVWANSHDVRCVEKLHYIILTYLKKPLLRFLPYKIHSPMPKIHVNFLHFEIYLLYPS